MWCNVCQCDVVTELTADNTRALCSTCGQVLSAVAAEQTPPTPQATDENPRAQARDLLDRWASSHLFDPYGPPKNNVDVPSESVPAHAAQQQPLPGPAGTVAAATPQQPVVAGQVPPPPGPALHQQAAMQPVQPSPHNQTNPPGPAAVSQAEQSATSQPASAAGYAPVHPAPTWPTAPLPEVVPQPPPPVVQPQTAVSPATMADGAAAGEENLNTSSEELDRLTNEILSRVSRISEDRQRRIEVAAAELADDASADVENDSEEEPVSGIDLTRRVDAAHEPLANHSVAEEAAPADEHPESLDESEVAAFTAPPAHDAPAAAESHASESSSSSGSSLPGLGHILSYIGILGLTAGTSFVIVGYFGGPATYAPTGWLVATIGQMLLFLGIVTLVSNGMEQTSEELQNTVNSRIDELSGSMQTLGDRMIRIEKAESESPKRPHMLDRPSHADRNKSVDLRIDR